MKKLFFHVTLHIVVVLAETLEGGTVEFLLGRRVGYGDDQACALLQRLAVEVYGPVLGYEPVVVTTPAPGDSTGAIFEMPLLVTEGMAMMALPPFDSDAPYTKSICPPTPE